MGQCTFSFKLNRRNKPRTVENQNIAIFVALNRVGPRTVENHNVIHSGGKPPKCVCCKKNNSYVFNQIELTQGVTQWRNTDHLLSVWLHLIRSGQSESAQRGPHWREAFMFFKCVSGVNKFWHFSKIEPNQLTYSGVPPVCIIKCLLKWLAWDDA